MRAAELLGIEWHTAGTGFTRRPESSARSIEAAREGWALGQAKIASDEYDLIVLDEFTYVLKYGWLDADEAIAWLRKHKPPQLHLVITGRGAPAALIDYADMVTDMCPVKHPYDLGVKAQVGIEF
jgi:cob(I)alamin adenosyltransferase